MTESDQIDSLIRHGESLTGITEQDVWEQVWVDYGEFAGWKTLTSRFLRDSFGDKDTLYLEFEKAVQTHRLTHLQAGLAILRGIRTSGILPKDEGLQPIPGANALHERIAGVSTRLLESGHYSDAVFAGSKALINYVKERSGRFDLDGADLMRQVFSRKDPVLAFNDLSDQSDFVEQEGMMHLFEGAVLAIRDPRGHLFVEDSPLRAQEYLALLSHLANRLEEAQFRDQ